MNIFNIQHPEDITLSCHQQLSQIDIAYHTFGSLNQKKDNVIVICHPLTGDSNALSWWSKIVGPNLPIDTQRYFVVCMNVLGGCYGSTGPSSICPNTKEPYGFSFPVITITDMVRVQRKLIESLGIESIKMVIGGSMGGMQALEWVAQCPDQVQSCVPIASTTKVSPLAIAFDAVGRSAITKGLADGNGGVSGIGRAHV